MEESTSREKILKRVRAALINKSRLDPTDVDFDSHIYHAPEEPLELVFAQQFSDIGGQFVFCENPTDCSENLAALVHDLKLTKIWCGEELIQAIAQQAKIAITTNAQDLTQAEVSITGCEFLVARTGTVVVSSRQGAGRRAPVFPNIHIVIAWTSQLVFQMKDALKGIRMRYPDGIPSLVSAITGPSRTADIEKTLVQGAHGPKEIFVFMIDDMPMG
jgi:L-lactate dehydrogenase complex protein LldG